MSANQTPARKWSEEHRPVSPEVDALEAEYASKMTTRLRIFALARKLETERDALREQSIALAKGILAWREPVASNADQRYATAEMARAVLAKAKP